MDKKIPIVVKCNIPNQPLFCEFDFRGKVKNAFVQHFDHTTPLNF